jgi:hypothetical protein
MRCNRVRASLSRRRSRSQALWVAADGAAEPAEPLRDPADRIEAGSGTVTTAVPGATLPRWRQRLPDPTPYPWSRRRLAVCTLRLPGTRGLDQSSRASGQLFRIVAWSPAGGSSSSCAAPGQNRGGLEMGDFGVDVLVQPRPGPVAEPCGVNRSQGRVSASGSKDRRRLRPTAPLLPVPLRSLPHPRQVPHSRGTMTLLSG